MPRATHDSTPHDPDPGAAPVGVPGLTPVASRTTLAWPAGRLTLDLRQIPRLLGIPPHRQPPAETLALVHTARARLLDLALPRAIVSQVDRHVAAAIANTSAAARPHVPLDDIVARADACVLFVATLGPGVDRAIRETFDDDPALAFVLDGLASLAADALRALVAAEALARHRVECRDEAPRLAVPYNPGHCGVPLAAQHVVFDTLGPASAIGVTLTDGGLMEPAKSVSGLVLIAPRAVHDVGMHYDCCAACAGRHCRAALATAPSTESRWVPTPTA